MVFQSIQLNNGKVFHGEKIGELGSEIINKFSEAGLSCDEAKIVLDEAKGILGEFFEQIERERSVEIMSEKDVIEVTVSILVSILTALFVVKFMR